MTDQGGTTTLPRRGIDLPNGDGGARTPAAARRRIGRPRSLPGARAVVGGLLVTVAMVGAVAVSRASGAPPTVPVVVASESLTPWQSLGPHNLEIVHLALPDELIASTYADPVDLGGTVSRSHVAAGEVVQRGGVVEATAAQRAAAPAREVSLRVDLDRAVDGRLEAGDRVDVLATYGNGVEALTFVVLTDAPVLSVVHVDGGVASARNLVLTLALERRAETIALAHAVDNADVTVVRTTTADLEAGAEMPFRPTIAEDE